MGPVHQQSWMLETVLNCPAFPVFASAAGKEKLVVLENVQAAVQQGLALLRFLVEKAQLDKDKRNSRKSVNIPYPSTAFVS